MKTIVTGYSRGLGAAIAAELLQRGIAVLGLARQPNHVLQQQFPDLLCQYQIDLSDLGAVQRWLASPALTSFLRPASIACLINNAGVAGPLGALSNLPPAAIAASVTLNTTVPLMLASAVAAAMATNGAARQCRILHVSSGAGRDAYANWSIYGASKAALDHHARAAWGECPDRVRICSLAPGVIDTDMQAQLRTASDDLFPLQERFSSLQRDGLLNQAHLSAARIVSLLLADRFGMEPVAGL